MERATCVGTRAGAAVSAWFAAAVSIWLLAPTPVQAQSDGCVLVADDRNPTERILRCGRDLVIRAAPATRYRLTGRQGAQPPAGAELDSGALLIELAPGRSRRNFQILTPHAIAAVRGTTWAVEVEGDRTSTLAVSGAVRVMRRNQRSGAVTLRAGQGVDVSPGSAPLEVKRWGEQRVRALLARFGQ